MLDYSVNPNRGNCWIPMVAPSCKFQLWIMVNTGHGFSLWIMVVDPNGGTWRVPSG